MKRYSVYDLCIQMTIIFQNGIDLSTSLFYIGKGTSKRVNAHERDAAKPERITEAYSL
jgi:hypothetical protein